MEQYILDYFREFNFDVRKSRNARFMDQKCIPDVVCAVCECVMEYTKDHPTIRFTKNDIWHSKYANRLVTESFSKPTLNGEDTNSEYDKFFGQPLKMLAYAKVLQEEKIGRTNYYTIRERGILEYISLRERNALVFLDLFLTKVMQDSGIMQHFECFFEKQDKDALYGLRDELNRFYHDFTEIQNGWEPSRIYNKIINIFAFRRRLKGTIKGGISTTTITIDEIRYNRTNWRDINKDKTMSRQEYNSLLERNLEKKKSVGFYKYSVQKAKNFVRRLHEFSEIHRFQGYSGSQAHHIFMESEYPEIADFPENIICITPNQHLYRAHPNNHTARIDKDYQLICLLSKLDSIEMNNREGRNDYSLADFVRVLNVGLDTDVFTLQMDYEEIKHQIVKNCWSQRVG